MKNPSHPGRIARRSIEDLGLTVTEAAEKLGLSHRALSSVLNGHAHVSPEIAVRFSKGGLGGSIEHWLRMQARFDAVQARDLARSIEIEPLGSS